MNIDSKNAIEQIKIIGDSIENTKRNANTIYKLFLVVGIINLINFIAGVFLPIYVFSMSNFSVFISSTIEIIGYALMLMYFARIYYYESNSSNKYYVSFINFFMIVNMLMPLISRLVRVTLSVFSDLSQISIMTGLGSINATVNIMLFIFSLVTCNVLFCKNRFLNNVLLIIISIAVMNFSFFEMSVTVGSGSHIFLRSIIYLLIISIGYIALGIAVKSRDINNGD